MNAPDLDTLLTSQLPTVYRVAYVACPSQADELFSEAVYLFLKWGRVKPAKYAALIATPQRTAATFRQLTRKAFFKILHDEKYAESLDALESETGISEIEWGEITNGAAIAQQRARRVHWVQEASADEDRECLSRNLAKASWGGLDYLDIAPLVRESDTLRDLLSGYEYSRTATRTEVSRAIQSLQNQI